MCSASCLQNIRETSMGLFFCYPIAAALLLLALLRPEHLVADFARAERLLTQNSQLVIDNSQFNVTFAIL